MVYMNLLDREHDGWTASWDKHPCSMCGRGPVQLLLRNKAHGVYVSSGERETAKECVDALIGFCLVGMTVEEANPLLSVVEHDVEKAIEGLA